MKKSILILSLFVAQISFAKDIPCSDTATITSIDSKKFVSCMTVPITKDKQGKYLVGKALGSALIPHHRSIAYYCKSQDPVFLTDTTISLKDYYEKLIIKREFYCED